MKVFLMLSNAWEVTLSWERGQRWWHSPSLCCSCQKSPEVELITNVSSIEKAKQCSHLELIQFQEKPVCPPTPPPPPCQRASPPRKSRPTSRCLLCLSPSHPWAMATINMATKPESLMSVRGCSQLVTGKLSSVQSLDFSIPITQQGEKESS